MLLNPKLHKYGWRKYSQNDEDGILDYIFFNLSEGSGYRPTEHYYVEIGISPPESTREDNCRLLYETGWEGLRIDARVYPNYGVIPIFITPDNINSTLKDWTHDRSIDLLSLDIDGQDYWVWQAMEANPKVMVIEYNASLRPDISVVVPQDNDFAWDGTDYYGASLRALWHLGNEKDYTLVYANGVNAFFLRDEILDNRHDFKFENIYRHRSEHPPDTKSRLWEGV